MRASTFRELSQDDEAAVTVFTERSRSSSSSSSSDAAPLQGTPTDEDADDVVSSSRRSKVQIALQRPRLSRRVTSQRTGRGSKWVRSCLHVGWRCVLLNVLIWTGSGSAALFASLALGHALEEFKDPDLDPTLVFATLAVLIGVFTVVTYAIYLAEAFGVDLRGDDDVDAKPRRKAHNRNRQLALLQGVTQHADAEARIAALREVDPKLQMSITGMHAVERKQEMKTKSKKKRKTTPKKKKKKKTKTKKQTKRGRVRLSEVGEAPPLSPSDLAFRTVTRERTLDYDHCEDQTMQNPAEMPAGAAAQLLFSKFVYSRDEETQTSLEGQRRRFERDVSRSGECARFDTDETWRIPGFDATPLLAVEGMRPPCWLSVGAYTFCTLLGVSAIYRIFIELATVHVFVDVIKRIEINAPPALLAAGGRSDEYGHLAVVTKLIAAGADVDKATANNARTPLYTAAQNGNLAIVIELIAAGADVDKALTTTGTTPLLIASRRGHLTVVTKLIAAGAIVNKARTIDGCTPLFIAAQEGHLAVVTKLVAAGADKSHRWKNRTALEQAQRMNKHAVAAFLS